MSLLLQDTRYAIRRLSRTPVFSLFAIAILAIGIGLNVTVFGLVDALLLRPPPFAEPDRIVHIYQDSDSGEPASTAYPAYRDIAAMTDVFASVAATRSATANWETPDGPREVAVDFATASYLSVLGLSPSRGSWFDGAQDAVGGEMAAVVSDKAWRTRFASDPNAVGQTIRLNNQPITIIGIGPRDFNGGDAGAISTDFWLSISSVGIGGPFAVANLERRQDHWYGVKARLAPGVAVERARGELASLAARHGELYPDIDKGRDITLFRLGEVRVHPQLDKVLTGSGIGLFVVAGAVLLLACGNLANLLLVRGFARTPELAIREALGGDRSRVGRPLLLEALLLSALGGALGLVAASWLQGVLSSVPLPPANSTIDVRFDYRMVLFSVVAALGTGCLFGVLPSWRSAATNVATALRDAGRTQSSGGSSALRSTLVAAQVALSVVLVTATALLARSFVNAERVDPGVDAERIAVIGTNLLQAGVTQLEAPAVASQILERVGALPGVESAALTIRLPLAAGPTSSTIVEGYELPRGASAIEMPITSVSNDYFATMGIRRLAGRTFSAVDRRESPPVVVISETAARVFFGGDAVGRRVRGQDDPDAWREVIGVVSDVKVAELQEPPTPLMYLSIDQTGTGGFSVVVRTRGDPAALLGVLPSALRSVRASLPVTRIDVFETYVAAALEAARTSALLMGAFAGLALLLAGLGVYAAVAFSVERRTQEIGIRVALGATAPQLLRMVVGNWLKIAFIGVAVGLVLAIAAAQGMQAILFGVVPIDTVSFGVAALLLTGAAALAAFVPARHALRARPSDVLRSQ
jgi:putative ABC transport system permease protein